ncbi:rhamnulokinase [Caproiciproducens sp. NJN-50]|uniref:rhamnulokinase n=1 Tax=Acutalibacteraceae TaxID=3082771 RepID=UPI000FFE2DEF|nr:MULTISPECIES: rhamnulokinase [Acutalibacteraceae]QAT48745.1 rhamnulokinase [Caproiciproducens sp. NJN-50]
MKKYYLAVDIGASSGRHVLACLDHGKFRLEEIYRFPNSLKNQDGAFCWDLGLLYREILNGLKRCRETGKIPSSMGIDTWAVDFVLLDRGGNILGQSVSYRDDRTKGMDQIVDRKISPEELYERTGIQKQLFNTIYQLMSIREKHPEQMESAKNFLMIPDYFNFLLTGVKLAEYTNATTTQLVNVATKTWDSDLIRLLGYKPSLFPPVSLPGTTVGLLSRQVREEVGFDLKVVQVASHDTASAIVAVPAKEKSFLYLSSGTWSLVGIENREPLCTGESREANLTNEGGYADRFLLLKNVMGLWMIQSIRREWDGQISFSRICEEAEKEKDFPSRIDVNDGRFFAPESMISQIRECCRETGQRVPQTIGEIASVIYNSLAENYEEAVSALERAAGEKYHSIYIVGGGSQDHYLNQLTSDGSGLAVYAGPTEATAIGNIIVQMIKERELSGLEQAREIVSRSFPVQPFRPRSKIREGKL